MVRKAWSCLFAFMCVFLFVCKVVCLSVFFCSFDCFYLFFFSSSSLVCLVLCVFSCFLSYFFCWLICPFVQLFVCLACLYFVSGRELGSLRNFVVLKAFSPWCVNMCLCVCGCVCYIVVKSSVMLFLKLLMKEYETFSSS